MGGHAFRGLHCPRISKEVYARVKQQTTAALKTVFSHVVVPTEMPEKEDYGDIDFLVSNPFHSPASTSVGNFDWIGTIQVIKSALDTTHGRRGFKNPECMYFAIRTPCVEDAFWIQVDVKVCFKPELFEWATFELHYASNSKMIGSMVKPLGLTIDPEGLHIRVEDVDKTNFSGSMVWISREPRDILGIMGLDRRILDAGFKTKDEIYEYFITSWLFNPAHFAARLAEERYFDRLEDRSPHWTFFIKTWLPEHYPGYKFIKDAALLEKHIETTGDQQNAELQSWYHRTRAAVREKVFTTFPHVATEYYTRRAIHVKEQEEKRLRAMIIAALPVGNNGWKDDLPQPRIIDESPGADQNTPKFKPTAIGELTPPSTPKNKIFDEEMPFSGFALPSPVSSRACSSLTQSNVPWDVPLYVDRLTRTPERPCLPRPPPVDMASDRKLLCLARWTRFDPTSGTPRLLSSPRDKDFNMHWTDATYAGATDKILVEWAREMWWHTWIRQCHVNYAGMWNRRFEKEDRKAENKRQEEEAKTEAKRMAEASTTKLLERLKVLNVGLGLVDDDFTVV